MAAPSPPFELTDRTLTAGADGVTLACSYRLGDDEFTERFVLDAALDPEVDLDAPIIEHLLDVAHLCVGVSYFKLTMPTKVVSHRALHPTVAALVPHLYDHGLRELAVRNGLDVPVPVRLDAPVASGEPAIELRDATGRTASSRGPLVPFGGGKDSTLTLAVLGDATALAIHPTAVQRRVAAAAGVELLGVQRTLDPLLAVRTAEGGLNGHIPITAINSTVSAVFGRLLGHTEVVMANERSSEEPTRFVGAIPVNHQYSKSFACEVALADALRPAGVKYYSLLRRYSEIAIAGALSQRADLRTQILSCNRAFSLNRPVAEPTWCLDCAKCRFTFLSFALFLPQDAAVEMFGGNLLDDPDQVEGVRALWADKPFDCVGELAESAIALARLADDDEWRSTAVVTALRDEAKAVAASSGTSFAALVEPSGMDRVPEARRAALDAVMARRTDPVPADGPR